MAQRILERIDLFPFEIPLVSPFRIATMLNSSAKGVFVRVTSADGGVGWGECLPFHAINGEDQATCMAALPTLARSIIDQDCHSVKVAADLMESILPAQTTAISGIEIALHDLAARRAGLPLYAYLGGSARPLPTDLTIGIVPSSEAESKAKEIVQKGYKAIKVKLGSTIPEDGLRVAAIRQAAGAGISIRVDANQGYSTTDALKLLEAIAKFDVEFCEQPVKRHDRQGLKWLHQRSPVPIMPDESCFSPADAADLLSRECCSLLNVKLCKSGGITRAMQIASVARAFHAPCMMGGMAETRIGVTAAAHLATAESQFRFYDLDAFVGHSQDVVSGGIWHEDGHVHFSQEPGLGATPTPDFLETFECVSITL